MARGGDGKAKRGIGVHGSSESGDWETDPSIISGLAPVFPWSLDVCALRDNVCSKFYTPWDDGLSRPWYGLCWMNPPYGRRRKIDRWMEKARKEGTRPETSVVCLVPARTSTAWWQDNVPSASFVVFIRGRLHFVLREHFERKENGVFVRVPEKRGPASFPSAFVVFGHLNLDQIIKLKSYGYLVVTRTGADLIRTASERGVRVG